MENEFHQIRDRSSELYNSIFQNYQTIFQVDHHQIKEETIAAHQSSSGSVLADCTRVLQNYFQRIQQKPKSTNTNDEIEFWKKFVAEFYAEDARVGICMSAYNQKETSHNPEQWKKSCGICQANPGFGFEFSKEFLPGLCMFVHTVSKINEQFRMEHMFSCKPALGPAVLKSAIIRRATVFQERLQLRAGRLNITFNSDMKICAADFCACDDHDPLRSIPQIDDNTKVILEKVMMMLDMQPEEEEEAASSSAAPSRPLDTGKKAFFRALQGADVIQFTMDLMKFTTKHGAPPPETMAMGTSTRVSYGV